MTSLSKYQDAFGAHPIPARRRILEMALHTDGGPFVFDEKHIMN
jgi:hypothetical protein